MARGKGRVTKIRGWSDEDRRVIAGMRVAMRMAKLPETLVQMLTPTDLHKMAPLEKAAYLRLADRRRGHAAGRARPADVARQGGVDPPRLRRQRQTGRAGPAPDDAHLGPAGHAARQRETAQGPPAAVGLRRGDVQAAAAVPAG